MKKKVLILTLLLIATGLFWHCSEEIHDNAVTFGVKHNQKIKKLYFMHPDLLYKQNPKIKKEVSEKLFMKQTNKLISNTYNFEIDENEVQILETNDYKMYSFYIKSSNDQVLKNYILMEYPNDSIRHFLADYNFQIINGVKTYNSQSSILEISNPNFLQASNRTLSIGNDCQWVSSISTMIVFVQGNRCGCEGQHFFGDLACSCFDSPPTPNSEKIYDVITWSQDCSSSSAGGGGGSGGGSGDEVLTVPFDKDDNNNVEMEDCDVLKDLLKPEKQNLKPIINSLKTKASSSKNEWCSSQKMENVYNSTSNSMDLTYSNTPIIEGSPTSSQAIIGSDYIGSTHSHPKGTDPIFSWGDLETLRDTYKDCRNSLKGFVSIQIVCYNKNNPAQPLVYSLRINDFTKLDNKINSDWNDSKLNGKNAKQKLDIIHADLARSYKANENNLESFFLNNFKDYGIDLFKANSDQTNWSKLSLNTTTNNPNGELETTPCP